MKRMFVLGCSMALLFAGCDIEVDEIDDPSDGEVGQSLTPGVPVRLIYAKSDSKCAEYTNQGSCKDSIAEATVSGYVEVDNLAFKKEVVVRYQGQDGNWTDIAAKYAGPTTNGREAWFFQTGRKTYEDRLGTVFPFAIRYSVGGKTYWDNNSQNDYRVGAGPRTFSPTELLETATHFVSWQQWFAPQNSVSGTITLKNLAYNKVVKVRYSTDGWKTVQEVAAKYNFGTTDLEHWSFDAPVGVNATQIEFAVSYTVNGKTYWDNNFRRNYTLTKPVNP